MGCKPRHTIRLRHPAPGIWHKNSVMYTLCASAHRWRERRRCSEGRSLMSSEVLPCVRGSTLACRGKRMRGKCRAACNASDDDGVNNIAAESRGNTATAPEGRTSAQRESSHTRSLRASGGMDEPFGDAGWADRSCERTVWPRRRPGCHKHTGVSSTPKSSNPWDELTLFQLM